MITRPDVVTEIFFDLFQNTSKARFTHDDARKQFIKANLVFGVSHG